MPNVPDEMDEVIQPLITQPIHTTPPNEYYVAPATKSILDDLLKEVGDEILNVIMVDEEIQVHSVIINLEPFIHTQLMSPLYGIYESYKSSTKPYKVDREMKSPSSYTGNAHRVVSRKEASKTGLVGCFLGVACDGGCCSRKHGLEHAVSSYCRANPGE
ncbi:hypothetical protein Tco_0077634 [Tanacetum coccineum]